MDINELLCSLCCDIGVFITNMNVLFEYDITFGDSENYKEYSADGALCYPDGWSEFIKTLMEY